jgi:hypothetical protein
LTLELEERYKAMHKLPFNRKVLHVDATGRLVFVPNYMHKYNQILTYAFIVQDIEKLSNETSSVDSNYLLLSVSSLKLSPCLLLIFRENINPIQLINQIIFSSHFN